jgi:surface antigen
VRKALGAGALATLLTIGTGYWAATERNLNTDRAVGEEIDQLHGVAVYHNGGVGHVDSRNLTPDDYNIGLRWQCVEFVKRYYYEHYGHKMRDASGNAKDFHNADLVDGAWNERRGLHQFDNPSADPPQVGDLVVYSDTIFNRYGHVAIVSKVDRTGELEIIQQNAGPFADTRQQYGLTENANTWRIENNRIVGWLGKR